MIDPHFTTGLSVWYAVSLFNRGMCTGVCLPTSDFFKDHKTYVYQWSSGFGGDIKSDISAVYLLIDY